MNDLDDDLDRMAAALAARLTALLAADTEDPAHTLPSHLTYEAYRQRSEARRAARKYPPPIDTSVVT